jgi:hypothetical protein
MKTNTPFGADFEIVHIDNLLHFVIIKDLDQGNKSVTNDAEAVVERMLLEVGRFHRIFYIDSCGQTDELEHDGVKFTGFKFGIPQEFSEACNIC